jgi:hypothetical protein
MAAAPFSLCLLMRLHCIKSCLLRLPGLLCCRFRA